jgi:hypothetical protein
MPYKINLRHLINNLGISNVTSHQSPGCNLPPVYTIIQQPVHHDRKHPQRTKADMIGSAARNHSFLAHPDLQPPECSNNKRRRDR